MKILVYRWGGINEGILKPHLEKLGHEIYEFAQECADYNTDMLLASNIINEVHKYSIDSVLSWNFFPIVAVTCNAVGIKYYSWVYDSPHLTLYSNAAKYDTNIIGIFDRALADHLRQLGVKGACYVPLATDRDDFNRRITVGSRRFTDIRKDGACDVSFVGSLYTDASKTDYYDQFGKNMRTSENEDIWKTYDSLVECQCFNRKEFLFTPTANINYDYIERLMLENGADLGPDYFADIRDIVITTVFERKVTIEERQKLMNQIAKYCNGVHKFNLYTTSDTGKYYYLNKVNRGPVDNISEMPRVFRNSKINLHITLRSIRTGIPLRVFDVLGCGGFLLCDPQEDILEYFEDGKDIALYSSPEECCDKIRYYLMHETERKNIAQNAQAKAIEEFSYEKMLGKLLSC